MLNLFMLLLAVPGISVASDYHSPRTASLGGAGHAGPMLNDSILLNPSFISFLPTYAVEFNYLLFNNAAPPAPISHGKAYNLSIQDGRSDIFQAGASYTQREDGTFVHLGASKAVLKELGVGLGGKFFFNNPSLPNGKDMSISTTYLVTPEIQSALILDNAIQTDASKAHGMYRELVLGLKYNLKGIMLLYFDPHYAPDFAEARYGYEGGLELVLFNDLLLRGGMSRGSTVPFAGQHGKTFGLGFGWIGPRISIDYALQRMTAPYTATAHTFGTTVYF